MNPIRWYETLSPKWYVTSRYGPRTGRYAGFHNGVDLGGGGGCNASIRTPYGGKVLLATNVGMGTAGKSVIIQVAPDLLQYHFHLNDYRCKVGDIVKAGDVIGTNGGTNNTSTPYACHIHYEIRRNNGRIPWGCSVWGDPEKFHLIQEPDKKEERNSDAFSADDLIEVTSRVPLNIRQRPGINSLIIGQVVVGEKVRIIPNSDNGISVNNHYWWNIDKNNGWVAEKYIKLATIEPEPHFIDEVFQDKKSREEECDGVTPNPDSFERFRLRFSELFKRVPFIGS